MGAWRARLPRLLGSAGRAAAGGAGEGIEAAQAEQQRKPQARVAAWGGSSPLAGPHGSSNIFQLGGQALTCR